MDHGVQTCLIMERGVQLYPNIVACGCAKIHRLHQLEHRQLDHQHDDLDVQKRPDLFRQPARSRNLRMRIRTYTGTKRPQTGPLPEHMPNTPPPHAEDSLVS